MKSADSPVLELDGGKTPIWGCILIGGKSSRMGQPKHLITDDHGITWLEHTVEILKPFVDEVVLSGDGALPASLTGLSRLVDIPGVVGPLTGILSAVRWLPQVSWLVIACDMPHISAEAVEWLLSHRWPGYWGYVPRMIETSHFEPLFALYDPGAAALFECQALSGEMGIRSIARHPKIMNPVIPESLRYGWENVNTPEQLQEIERRV
jgi:molybdopterin-guanine dinucleotide biosynthesis protein A